MKLTLIGMSNVGKTFWSRRLESLGFIRFGCDDLIEEKLEVVLKGNGYSGIADMARWMGQPYEDRYTHNSRIYLEAEQAVVSGILEKLKSFKNGTRIIVDTTGSLIYLNSGLITELKKFTKFIYLDVTPDVKREMFESYIRNPKPVIWGDKYSSYCAAAPQKALAECYPRLLDHRIKLYREYADLTIDYHSLRSGTLTAEDFLKRVSLQ